MRLALHAPLAAGGSIRQTVETFVANLRIDLGRRYGRWQKYRAALAQLRDYTPDQLTELGISPVDIHRVAREEAAR